MCTGKYIECSKVVDAKPVRKMTRRQEEVMNLRERLPGLTDRQRQWILDVPFRDEQIGYYNKLGDIWCQHCGHQEKRYKRFNCLTVTTGEEKYVCPHCGTTLTLKPYYAKGGPYYNVCKACTTATSLNGYTVLRTFLAERTNNRYAPTEYSITEIYQSWIGIDGKETVLSLPYYYSLYSLQWNTASDMWSVRHPHKWNSSCSYYYTSPFSVRSNWFIPGWRVSPIMRRNGWTNRFCRLSCDQKEIMRSLLTDPQTEMLAKTRQIALCIYRHHRMDIMKDDYLHAIRVCNRRKYIVNDASLWYDYLDLLTEFGKDTHNAYYVCPSDLKAAHDRLMEKKRRITEAKEAEERRLNAIKHEAAYKKTHGSFFGISFDNGIIFVHVISSVSEMAEEGKAMHHCVYENGYYKKKTSLILSARDVEGNRLETVEVDLLHMSIIQSRAKFNGISKYHQQIIDLVMSNINLLREGGLTYERRTR